MFFFLSKEKKLFSAIKKGDVEKVVQLLDDVDPNFFRNGITPLIYAAQQGNIKAIEKIIQKGGNPQLCDSKDRSALMYAAYSGNSRVVDILSIASPSNIFLRDKEGLTAINHAHLQGYKGIVERMNGEGVENRLPLHTMYRNKEVGIKGIGQDIRNLDLTVKSKTDNKSSGIILPGSVIHSNDGSQDMVCTETIKFDLNPKGSFSSNLKVACVDGNKPIPRSHNSFSRASYNDRNLIRIVNEMKGKDPNSLQAAIWAYRNRYSSQEIRDKLRTGNASRTVIKIANIAEAKEVLDKLGIRRNL